MDLVRQFHLCPPRSVWRWIPVAGYPEKRPRPAPNMALWMSRKRLLVLNPAAGINSFGLNHQIFFLPPLCILIFWFYFTKWEIEGRFQQEPTIWLCLNLIIVFNWRQLIPDTFNQVFSLSWIGRFLRVGCGLQMKFSTSCGFWLRFQRFALRLIIVSIHRIFSLFLYFLPSSSSCSSSCSSSPSSTAQWGHYRLVAMMSRWQLSVLTR